MLSSQFIERLVVSLIRAEQDRLVRHGLQTRQTHIDTCLGPMGGLQLSELTVDEDHLGFDSLARLDLVAGINRVFGLSATGIEDYLLVHRGISDWVHLIGEHFKKIGEGAEITFSSSGSTGTQSHHTHSLTALRSEVSGHLCAALAAHTPTRVLVSVPLHHIYGFLWGGMIPDALEAEAIDLPAGHASAIQREARAGDLVISTPFWMGAIGKNRRGNKHGLAPRCRWRDLRRPDNRRDMGRGHVAWFGADDRDLWRQRDRRRRLAHGPGGGLCPVL